LGGDAGEAEVHDDDPAGAVEHDVRRLEVAVDDTAGVRGHQPGAQRVRHLHALVLRQPPDPLEERRQVLAVDELHRDEGDAVGLTDVVDPADVRVRHLAGGADLVVEPGDGGAVAAERLGQELQRHLLVELHVVGAVDLPHPAAAEQAQDAVAPRDRRADLEPALDKITGRHHGRGGVGRQEGSAGAARRRAVAELRRARRAPRHGEAIVQESRKPRICSACRLFHMLRLPTVPCADREGAARVGAGAMMRPGGHDPGSPEPD
jgi:hypothetical protein